MIRILNDDDYGAYEAFLKPYAATSMFMRSNAARAGLAFDGEDFQGEYLGFFDDVGALSGVLVHYWNGNIMMQCGYDAALWALVAAFLQMVKRSVGGVLGPDDQARAVIDGLGLSDAAFVTNRNEVLYSIDLADLLVPEHDAARFSVVPVCAVELSVLHEWLKAYEIETRTVRDPDYHDAHVADRAAHLVRHADCWALLCDGAPVSLSGFNARLADAVQVGPVWTPVTMRGRGYARILLALNLMQARAEGVESAVLFTDNPAGEAAYQAVGFRATGTYRLALLEKSAQFVRA